MTVSASEIRRLDPELFDRIVDRNPENRPTPHVFVRDVLSDTDVSQMLANWPEETDFENEPGMIGRRWVELASADSLIVPITDPSRREFWHEVSCLKVPVIVAATVTLYERLIGRRFPDGFEAVEMAQLTILDTTPEYFDHAVHTHYPHSPDWLFTNLVYLDDGDQTDRGTRLLDFATPELRFQDEACFEAAYPIEHIDLIGDALPVPFEKNSMFSMLDGPMSFHAGPPVSSESETNHRKILRMHVRASADIFDRHYDTDKETFTALFRQRSRHGKFFAGVRNDFDAAREAWSMEFEPDRAAGPYPAFKRWPYQDAWTS